MELGDRVEPHYRGGKPTKNDAQHARRPKQGPRQLVRAEDGKEPERRNGCPVKHVRTLGQNMRVGNRQLVPVIRRIRFGAGPPG